MGISEVPMLTTDGREIELNNVLYTITYSRGTRYHDPEEEVTANRVISVNASARHLRMRCPAGCEEEVSFNKGCSRTRLYSTFEAAKSAIIESIARDLEKNEESKKELLKGEQCLKDQIRKVRAFRIGELKVPKEVKIKAKTKA